MYDFLYEFNSILNKVNTYVSDYVLVVLLSGVGIFYTFKTNFVQVRCFGEGIRHTFSGMRKNGENNKGTLSSFQALCTSVAAQIGTGNIVGACSAILVGGPGSVFWMWVVAFFGMATSYAEGVIAIRTRIKNRDGTYFGGPYFYIKKAFRKGFGDALSKFFAIASIVALGFSGSMVQSNAVSESIYSAFGIPCVVTGIVMAIAVGFVIVGGTKKVSLVAEYVVPIMAALFFVGSIAILVLYYEKVPQSICLVFKNAFSKNSVFGTAVGYSVKQAFIVGAKRGLFSNEAGMGTAPCAHALANVKSAHEQGTVAMLGTFLDTMLLMTTTSLSVITVLYDKGVLSEQVTSTNMAQIAFTKAFGDTFGEGFVAISLFFFAFTSILGWSFFGRMNVKYVFGKGADSIYTRAVLLFVFLGSFAGNELSWNLTDFFNQLMVVPNVLALFSLCKSVPRCKSKKM